MKGIVFNIQKFCLHDGPGIRTVVFLKGCPLRCAWCSNPESQRMQPQVLRDGDICTPTGEPRSVSDVLSVCLQDRPFYEESGGGVTLSGGEPLMQPDFAAALLDALRAEGIHTALETTGFVSRDVFDRVASKADLLLIDFKHWDDARHVAGTGVSNALILENMRRAARRGDQILPRIPVIPGYNDAPEDTKRFAQALSELGLKRAQLLPFHQFGEKKYEQLGLAYAYRDAKPLREQYLMDYRDAISSCGVRAFF